MTVKLSEAQRYCGCCGGSREIAVSVYYPMSYAGPGPVPEDATRVVARKCDECSGTGIYVATSEPAGRAALKESDNG